LFALPSEIIFFAAAGLPYVGRIKLVPLFDAAVGQDNDSAFIEKTKQSRLKTLEFKDAVADAFELLPRSWPAPCQPYISRAEIICFSPSRTTLSGIHQLHRLH